jgi:hypothetical protein
VVALSLGGFDFLNPFLAMGQLNKQFTPLCCRSFAVYLPKVEDDFLSLLRLGKREGRLQLLLRHVQKAILYVQLGDVDVGEEGSASRRLEVRDKDDNALGGAQA